MTVRDALGRFVPGGGASRKERLRRKREAQRERYRSDPEVRRRCKARAAKSRRPDDGAQTKAWRAKNRDRNNAQRRARAALYRAEGYDPTKLHGDEVVTTWGGTYRIVTRYAKDGEALCDLDDGKTVIKAVPLASCRLVST